MFFFHLNSCNMKYSGQRDVLVSDSPANSTSSPALRSERPCEAMLVSPPKKTKKKTKVCCPHTLEVSGALLIYVSVYLQTNRSSRLAARPGTVTKRSPPTLLPRSLVSFRPLAVSSEPPCGRRRRAHSRAEVQN